MQDFLSKDALFIVAWIVVTIALTFLGPVHCWVTRHTKQPWLLLGLVMLAIAQVISLPYTWDLPLQRYRNLSNLVLHLAGVALLTIAYV